MIFSTKIVNQTEQYLINFVKNTDVKFSMAITRANSLGTLYEFIKNQVEIFLN